MASAATSEHPARWWVPGDWNAFFGLVTNVVLNVIVLTGLTLGVVKLPGDSGVVYRGMELLGGGAILAGMILGAVAAFIIDRDFHRAAVYALSGAVLSFFGFIHGAKLGIGESSGVALGYIIFAFICWGLARRAGTPQGS